MIVVVGISVALVVFTVVVHEAGHAVAAAALRLPWRPAIVLHCRPAIIVGRDDLDLSRFQVAFTAAGGPAANLAVCAVAYSLGQPLVVLTGLLFAVVNLLPLPHSDGSRILRPGHAIARAKAAAPAAQESR